MDNSISEDNTRKLRKYCEKILEVPIFGVAANNGLPCFGEIRKIINKFPHVVVIGYKVSYAITETLKNGPNKIYLHHYRQLNWLLDRSAVRIAQWIERCGYLALPIPASSTIDWEKQLPHFSHRHAAVAAGLAWIGRNNLAITPQFGAHQRFVSILTDMPLIHGQPLKADCGDCVACISVCPANAIGMDSSQWNHEKCFEMLKKFSSSGLGHYICGLCVKVCIYILFKFLIKIFIRSPDII